MPLYDPRSTTPTGGQRGDATMIIEFHGSVKIERAVAFGSSNFICDGSRYITSDDS